MSKFRSVQWDYVILDEGHKIKNDQSLVSQNVRNLKCEYRLLLTGTPIQNNVHELWSLLNFLMPKIFENSEDFQQLYEYISDQEQRDTWVKMLHQMIRPFILRRLKAHVEKALPAKKEIVLFVGMSKLQKHWYKNIVQRNFEALSSTGVGRTMFNVLMQLRKVCNHP